MSSLAELVGAGIEVTVGGRAVKLYPLTLRQMGEWERWLQCRRAAAIASVLGPNAADGSASAARTAISAAVDVSYWSEESLAQMRTLEGQLQLIALSTRGAVTREWLSDHATFEELCSCMEAFYQLNFPETSQTPQTPQTPKKKQDANPQTRQT